MTTQITQLINDKGNPVANHFVINKGGELYLQSYNSIVAKRSWFGEIKLIGGHEKPWVFGVDWDYSRTTLKHLKTFLDFDGKKCHLDAMIETGTIEVDNQLSI